MNYADFKAGRSAIASLLARASGSGRSAIASLLDHASGDMCLEIRSYPIFAERILTKICAVSGFRKAKTSGANIREANINQNLRCIWFSQSEN